MVDMADVEVELPDRIDNQIDRFVEQGDFLNRDQAVEELLEMGIKSYGPVNDTEEELDDEFAGQAFEDQTDPALREEDDENLL